MQLNPGGFHLGTKWVLAVPSFSRCKVLMEMIFDFDAAQTEWGLHYNIHCTVSVHVCMACFTSRAATLLTSVTLFRFGNALCCKTCCHQAALGT